MELKGNLKTEYNSASELLILQYIEKGNKPLTISIFQRPNEKEALIVNEIAKHWDKYDKLKTENEKLRNQWLIALNDKMAYKSKADMFEELVERLKKTTQHIEIRDKPRGQFSFKNEIIETNKALLAKTKAVS